MKEVTIDFGSHYNPIAEQIESQGLAISEEDVKRIHELVDAIHLLDSNGILQDTVVFSCTRKVMREIRKAVKPRVTGHSL
jgi:hypothetical protein